MEIIVKSVEGSTVAASLGLRVDDATQSLGAGAVQRVLTPPYDPQRCIELFEHSSALNPAVTAIVANVHECGYRLEPAIDFSNANSTKQLRAAMMQERIAQFRKTSKTYVRKDVTPTDEEVEMRRADIELEIEFERCRIESFLSACCPFSTFGALRSAICRDELITGNAYIEIIRDEAGEVSQLHCLKSAGMRLGFWTHTPAGQVELIEVDYPQRTTAITTEMVSIKRPFRVFVQVGFNNTSFTHFKEFGDPRPISAKDGCPLKPNESVHSTDFLAHEVVWIAAPTQRIDSPYGVPVWIGAMPLVTGAMYAQLVNENHFNHKGIPQAFLFVDGADEKAVASLRENLRIQLQEIQDLSKYHALVIVGAVSSADDPNGKVTFKVEPMRQAVKDDGLFQKYDAQCHKHIWMQFRIPPMLLGAAEELNRASSDNVIRFAEGQVFGPMRQRFDDVMNMIMTIGLGIRFVRFVSNSPVQGNPKDMADMSKIAADVGALSINQHLALASDQFSTPFNRIDQPYADWPMVVVRGQLSNHVLPNMDPATSETKPVVTLTPNVPAGATKGEIVEYTPATTPPTTTTQTAPVPVDDHDTYVQELASKIEALREYVAGSEFQRREIQTSKGLALVIPYAEAYAHATSP